MLLNTTAAINGGLYEKQKSITVNFAPVCRYNALFCRNDSKCCRAASTKVGGTGLRYTVMICGKETYLFDEENGKWFVEGKSRVAT